MERLAELRESQALTLRDLAERSGVDANTINQVELGHRKARPSTLRKLAKALDVDVRELFEEPALSGKVEAPREAGPAERTVYSFRGEPRVTSEQLREHDIEVNDSELIVLNQLLHVRAHPPTGTYVMGHVVKKDEPVVDARDARITMLLAYIVRFILTPGQAEAWGEVARGQLVGAGR